MDYKEAKQILDDKRGDKTSKKIGNNTYLKRYEDGTIVVRLHQTDIIQYKPNGTILLHSGGWKTVTTKARMNEFLPRQYGIMQVKGVWYVHLTTDFNKDLVYNDGMKLTKSTKPVNEKVLKTRQKKNDRITNQIKKYADRYIEALFDGKVESPSGSDCWQCSMMYDKNNDRQDHYDNHLTNMYFVPSLIVNALKEMGASNMERDTVADIWQNGASGTYGTFAKDRLKQTLVKFMKRKVGVAR